MTSRVLMVDDEEDLVWTTSRQMQRSRPDLEFVGLTDPHEALRRVREQAPDLLITDLRMPQMSGLELLLAARETSPDLPVILVTAHGNGQVRTELQRTRAVQYMEKPFAFQALLDAVERALDRPTGFSGAISLPMLPDLVQMYALARMHGTLRISRGTRQGTLWFEAGEIVHATCAHLTGPLAVYELLSWEGGAFRMDPPSAPPARSVQASWQELLMEGCRLQDEGRREGAEAAPATAGTAAGSLGARAGSLVRALDGLLSEAPATVTALLADLDGHQALELCSRPAPAAWSGAVADLLRDVGGAVGSLECVGPDCAVGLAWDRRAGLALLASDRLGEAGPARFRSAFARWREAFHAGATEAAEEA